MSDGMIWLIPGAPLLATLLITFFGPRGFRAHSHWPCVLAFAVSFLVSAGLLLSGVESKTEVGYQWLQVGSLNIDVVPRIDHLSVVMLVTVTFVSLLVSIYAIGYMHGDPGYPRFFAEIALFVFSMTMLVLAGNFLVLYVFWEGVGLCSYLLIGFWFQKPSASAAARKAFLVTRIGDVGFFLGICLIWVTFGTLNYEKVFQAAPAQDATTMNTICLLLFLGAVGKSAQFPLHVWLPDAMEGPTPVSALIHAATMVTAGVYMVARCTPLFIHAPEAQLAVAGIGGFTALLAALIALTQNDLKRVMAYSTVSQLGYMFLALGSAAGNPKLATFAMIAAIFHLFTHAFFKALLFLASGSVMHAMGDVIDMRRFGGLRHVMPHTHWTFLFGALALAGIIPFAGFWSKDEILTAAYEASHGPYGLYFLILWVAGMVTAFLTAFYTFRAYFLTFWGEERFPPEAGAHPHESPPVMLVPLMILAAGALLAGLVFGPTHLFGDYLEKTPGFEPAAVEYGLNFLVMGGSLLLALGGFGLAWWFYLKRPELPGELQIRLRNWYELSANKFYLDEIYQLLIVGPLKLLALICRGVDHLVDGVVDLIGWIPALLGRVFRPVQNGLVQFYALAMLLGLTVFVIAVVYRLGG